MGHSALKHHNWISLEVQWLKLHTSTAGSTGLNPALETNLPAMPIQPENKQVKKKDISQLHIQLTNVSWN